MGWFGRVKDALSLAIGPAARGGQGAGKSTHTHIQSRRGRVTHIEVGGLCSVCTVFSASPSAARESAKAPRRRRRRRSARRWTCARSRAGRSPTRRCRCACGLERGVVLPFGVQGKGEAPPFGVPPRDDDRAASASNIRACKGSSGENCMAIAVCSPASPKFERKEKNSHL